MRTEITKRQGRRSRAMRPGFTLIELMLVLALLAIVVSVSAPQLSTFFKGRGLDLEVRRFISLTQYGQSRAKSEGVPMLLWFDEAKRTYRLQAESGYTESDPKAIELPLDPEVKAEVRASAPPLQNVQWNQMSTRLPDQRPTFRFLPDGFISPTSPERIIFRQGDNGVMSVAQDRTGMCYEIETNAPAYVLR